MFSLLWRFFPGPAWFRVFVLAAAVAVLAFALITYVYPWVGSMLPAEEATITQ